MKMPKNLAPLKSKRCSMAKEMSIETEDGRVITRRSELPPLVMSRSWAFKIRSISNPSCVHLQVFSIPVWNDRLGRAMILRDARAALKAKLAAGA
jgi:hypothetical protein